MLKLAVTVDVEEEGLFNGRYPRVPVGVANVRHLERLLFITREFGLPLTLLTTYRVAEDAGARQVLLTFREQHGAELGAHLHAWNTPPFGSPDAPEPLRIPHIPPDLLAGKLSALLEKHAQAFGEAPRAFRMGRFDWTPGLLKLLPELGLTVDSSMVPLTQVVGGPDHFLAPADPFRLSLGGDPVPSLLEAPLTLVPLFPGLARNVYRFSALFPGRLGQIMRAWFPFAAAAGTQPVWFPLAWMRLAVRLHQRRGGRVLTLLVHSSELMPGGTPHLAGEPAIQLLLWKIEAFLAWLTASYQVQGVTLAQLAGQFARPEAATPVYSLSQAGLAYPWQI